MKTKYKCSKCNLSVIVIDNNVIVACKCNAAIVAEISAISNGISSIKI